MLALKLAIRNIFAHKRKNLIILSVTAAISFFLFLFLTFSDGEIENIKNGVSSFFRPQSDIYITHPDYRDLMYKSNSTSITEATVQDLLKVKAIANTIVGVKESFGLTFNLYGDVFDGKEKYLDFNFLSFDADDSFLASKFDVLEGSKTWYEEGTPIVPILIHKEIKKITNIQKNDAITLVAEDLFGQITTIQARIAGFISPHADNLNLYNLILMPSEVYSAFAGYNYDEVNRVLVRINKEAKLAKIIPLIQDALKDSGYNYDVFSSSDLKLHDPWLQVFELIRYIVIVATLLVLFITSFGIMNVTSTNLAERKKEIGTYYCLGTEKPFLLSLYTIEIFFINLAGSILGIGFGFVGRYVINALKITSENPGFLLVVGGTYLHLGLSASTIFWIVGGISTLTVLTALTTLGKGLKVSPVEAIKEVDQ